ncbi:hypothetical protein PF008_g22769 [Phytophthora fragariae]|uniref:Secreted protein n=1 Tax=Phytophthora fragariae TaxID=53985 RepID=A0A6G0QSQ4_9STRA|nr:hypothetical protein PF008_g22769 [Phytophthora fragariae]
MRGGVFLFIHSITSFITSMPMTAFSARLHHCNVNSRNTTYLTTCSKDMDHIFGALVSLVSSRGVSRYCILLLCG